MNSTEAMSAVPRLPVAHAVKTCLQTGHLIDLPWWEGGRRKGVLQFGQLVIAWRFALAEVRDAPDFSGGGLARSLDPEGSSWIGLPHARHLT